MSTYRWSGLAAACIASAAQAQSLRLNVETGPDLADGLLSPGESASFSVLGFGESATDPYRMFGALYEFSFGTLGPGQFTHTEYNQRLVGFPGAPGLLYDDAAGRIEMSDTGGFWQVPGVLPPDVSNPIYLLSFEWTPSAYDGRVVDWTAAADHGAVYIGGDVNDQFTWRRVELDLIGSATGSFRVAPSPGAAAVLGIAAMTARRRRRRAVLR